MRERSPVIVMLGPRSALLAARIAEAASGSAIHAPASASCDADRRFTRLVPHLQALFTQGRPIIGLCAAGILIRALAPLLTDKRSEPPVLAVADDGSAVVPLLGGHHGANALAARLGHALGIAPAITTAGELRLGIALDVPPAGWRLADPALAKPFMASLLDGAGVRLTIEAGDGAWLRDADLPLDDGGPLEILVTARAVAAAATRCVLHPPVLAIGVGSERGAESAALHDLVRATLASEGLALEAVACVVSLDLKAAEPAIHAVAAALDAPARFFTRDELAAEHQRLAFPSSVVEQAVGVAGVAEAAALAAAGPQGRLLVTKRVGQRCTCAIALSPTNLNAGSIGRPRGRLAVVGIGPGDADSRTVAVIDELRACDDAVGYGLYLDLVADLLGDRPRHIFGLGEEETRCRFALQRAAEGRHVALVSSGDPGIFAMAALVMELLEREPLPAWQRVELVVLPGISAMQAAAARLGAPLGHDFCAISLSDLLTPAAVIEQRLQAAAQGDFVLALYNPVSHRRRELLPRARDILLQHRAPDTPVALARNLGRPDESTRIVPLADLNPDDVDMLTLVIVGSNATRRVPQLHGPARLVTPRGYRLP